MSYTLLLLTGLATTEAAYGDFVGVGLPKKQALVMPESLSLGTATAEEVLEYARLYVCTDQPKNACTFTFETTDYNRDGLPDYLVPVQTIRDNWFTVQIFFVSTPTGYLYIGRFNGFYDAKCYGSNCYVTIWGQTSEYAFAGLIKIVENQTKLLQRKLAIFGRDKNPFESVRPKPFPDRQDALLHAWGVDTPIERESTSD